MPTSVAMDPNDHKHLIIGFHGNCEAPYAPACEAETTDSGATWRLFKLPTKGWEEGAGPWVIDATTSLYGGNPVSFSRPIVAHPGRTSAPGCVGIRGRRSRDPSYSPRSRRHVLHHVAQGMVKSTDTKTWTLMPNSGGRLVGFTSGDGLFITSDQWSATLQHREDEQSDRVDQARSARRAAG